ncbi:ruvC [Wigglesworthia glossinidia endosymbiont of Glossina brevipalpis]|uniref:Crossover junction endodeoxyribonuclease RuvC n=1 Tax=Wigglesworthia glossinidia brevipalpis TaxID=36870 RepID=RUVC_WIGBR|nr:RecName: Full=Crossover junction endodeoxyribonuclease RuvC; AltName: Full=Holliday junction nuclease RuvC; AltName: Full=Holliday junction resolvase RuvC [Wigglesworthia glossinidia endosymbiont of Glossina brevipalpis]BAC24260.1 ruvC [Wigglesworthia glossinidia endosymbiont of Glossina brevipalpis]
MSIIIGIDPGSYVTGYGIIKSEKNTLKHIKSGSIFLKKHDFKKRLKIIYICIKNIINKFKPKYFVIEQIFFSKNPSSVLKLGQASCAATLAAINLDILIFEYASKKIKKILVGDGKAKKLQVKNKVCSILNLSKSIGIDTSDALAVAITHHYLINNKDKIF